MSISRPSHTVRLLAALLGAAALLCAAAGTRAAESASTLNLYAWSAYFPPFLISTFERELGSHVKFTALDSPDAAETILSAGHSGFDVVTMNASPQLAREIPHGFWKVLDHAAIPNARNVDPRLAELLRSADPGNAHAVAWMWGTTGILYDRDKILGLMPKAPVDSLDMIFNRELAAKFASCGINLLDSWGDILPMVARYLGQRQLSADKAPLDAVMAKLKEIAPYLRRVSTAGYYQQLAEGELCLAIGYSGDALIARRMVQEAHRAAHIDYSYAREIVPFYIDSMVVPVDAPHPAAALAFIDFVMRPDISAAVTRFSGFATANAAAAPLLEPLVRNNPLIYPSAAVRDRFELQKAYTPDEVRLFSRAWLQFKSGL